MKRTCGDCGTPEVSYTHDGDCYVCSAHRCEDCVPIGEEG